VGRNAVTKRVRTRCCRARFGGGATGDNEEPNERMVLFRGKKSDLEAPGSNTETPGFEREAEPGTKDANHTGGEEMMVGEGRKSLDTASEIEKGRRQNQGGVGGKKGRGTSERRAKVASFWDEGLWEDKIRCRVHSLLGESLKGKFRSGIVVENSFWIPTENEVGGKRPPGN